MVAFIVGDTEPAALIDYGARQLSVHKHPREVRIVAAAPQTRWAR
jgi:fatty acid CoA ligase FadD36